MTCNRGEVRRSVLTVEILCSKRRRKLPVLKAQACYRPGVVSGYVASGLLGPTNSSRAGCVVPAAEVRHDAGAGVRRRGWCRKVYWKRGERKRRDTRQAKQTERRTRNKPSAPSKPGTKEVPIPGRRAVDWFESRSVSLGFNVEGGFNI